MPAESEEAIALLRSIHDNQMQSLAMQRVMKIALPIIIVLIAYITWLLFRRRF